MYNRLHFPNPPIGEPEFESDRDNPLTEPWRATTAHSQRMNSEEFCVCEYSRLAAGLLTDEEIKEHEDRIAGSSPDDPEIEESTCHRRHKHTEKCRPGCEIKWEVCLPGQRH